MKARDFKRLAAQIPDDFDVISFDGMGRPCEIKFEPLDPRETISVERRRYNPKRTLTIIRNYS